MRCSCQNCDTYMVHAESMELGCVCPACGARCKACLGTDSVVSREALRSWKQDPGALQWLLEPRQEADDPWEMDEDYPFDDRYDDL